MDFVRVWNRGKSTLHLACDFPKPEIVFFKQAWHCRCLDQNCVGWKYPIFSIRQGDFWWATIIGSRRAWSVRQHAATRIELAKQPLLVAFNERNTKRPFRASPKNDPYCNYYRNEFGEPVVGYWNTSDRAEWLDI